MEEVNQYQQRSLFDKVSRYYNGDLKGKCFALWGLAFKPNTDDMREASSRVIMELLWENGAAVKAYDPEAMNEARRIYGERDDLTLCETANDAVQDADALIIVTEWKQFHSPDFQSLKEMLREPVIFDGRNLYEPARVEKRGFRYFAIGRGEAV